jgi:uncharacterized protein (TIGR03437 family)
VVPILLAISGLQAQTASGPEIELDVNAQSDAVVSRGWPLLIRALLISADGQPLSIALKSGAWTQALTLTVTASGGAAQKWPLQLVQPATSALSLSGLGTAEAVWLVAAPDSASIPEGVYNLSVALDTSSSAVAGAFTGSVAGGGASVRIQNESASLSTEDEASKYLAFAAYARLKGDAAGVGSALDTLISRQPTVLEAYREKADLLAANGDYAGALAIYEDTISRYLASHPNPTEPLGPLTRPVTAMAMKIAQQQSPGGGTVTSVEPGRTDTVFAPDSIVSAYGTALATSSAVASGSLTATLGGTSVSIADSTGASAPALLFSVSPGQVNYAAPASLKLGPATVTIKSGDGSAHTGSVTIADVQPAVFTLNAAGLVAGSILRVTAAGQVSENVYTVDASSNVVALPVDVSKDQVYLVFYATGIRRAAQSDVKVSIGGVDLPVAYAGPQGFFTGLDQVNVQLPASLAGRGDVPVVLSARGGQANLGRITFK